MRFRNVVRAVAFCVLVVGMASGIAYAQETGAPSLQPPQLANRAELLAAFRQYYPAELRRQGIGGTAQVRLYVDTNGVADSVRLTSPIGIHELDEAAISIAYQMKFTPALVNGEPRALWIDLPITLLPPDRIDSPSVNKIALANEDAIIEMVRANMPGVLVEKELAVTMDFWIQLDANGAVVDAMPERTSCIGTVDILGHMVAHELRFKPADGQEGALAGWTMVKLLFNRDSAGTYVVELEGEKELRELRRADDYSYLVAERYPEMERPQIVNRAEMQKLLGENYPSELMMAGVGGTVEIMIWIDEKGMQRKRMISKSSGVCKLDMSALEVIKATRFKPALLNGQPRRVVVSFPVNFRVD